VPAQNLAEFVAAHRGYQFRRDDAPELPAYADATAASEAYTARPAET
jgi:hypothetical protein